MRIGYSLLKASFGVLFLFYKPNKTEPNVKVYKIIKHFL